MVYSSFIQENIAPKVSLLCFQSSPPIAPSIGGYMSIVIVRCKKKSFFRKHPSNHAEIVYFVLKLSILFTSSSIYQIPTYLVKLITGIKKQKEKDHVSSTAHAITSTQSKGTKVISPEFLTRSVYKNERGGSKLNNSGELTFTAAKKSMARIEE